VTRTRYSKFNTQNRLASGFTLIEMVVVIVILSMVALLVIPRLPSTDAVRLKSSARSLASAIRYMGDRSVTAKIHYRLLFNLGDGSVSVKKVTADGEEVAADDPLLSRFALADGVIIEDIRISSLGKLAEGEVNVDFGAAGLAEFLTIHMKGAGGGRFTLLAYPNSGKVRVLDGYREWES